MFTNTFRGYYLPPRSDLTLSFIRDVLSGIKKVKHKIILLVIHPKIQVLKLDDLRPIIVPPYAEFAVNKMWPTVKADNELAPYFPDYPLNCLPNRGYLYNVNIFVLKL
jgi:hypothetical protein